jgi:DNA polymerase-3 subunit beta
MPEGSGTVPGPLFAGAVAQVAVAAGRDDMLPLLTGIRVEIEGERVTLAATDRYRLAVREFLWHPSHPDAAAVALVPARTLADTAKSLAGEVTLALSGTGQDTLLGLSAGGRRTTTRLIDGEFPKYRSLFPAEAVTTARVETAALAEAVKRVALVAERNTPVRLSFSADQVVLEAGSGEDAQASESLTAVVDGEDVSIGFNPGYLLDGLGAIDASYAHLAFTQSTRPAVIQGVDAVDGDVRVDYRYLLMPVRLSG